MCCSRSYRLQHRVPATHCRHRVVLRDSSNILRIFSGVRSRRGHWERSFERIESTRGSSVFAQPVYRLLDNDLTGNEGERTPHVQVLRSAPRKVTCRCVTSMSGRTMGDHRRSRANLLGSHDAGGQRRLEPLDDSATRTGLKRAARIPRLRQRADGGCSSRYSINPASA